MALPIEHVHNWPPHLSYVSTLPDITQIPKYDTDELKQRLTDTWNLIPQDIINEDTDQWQTLLCSREKTKEQQNH